MQTFQPSIFGRNDTLLGVCQAIGEDLGFNPTYLRVALAGGVFFNFGAAVAVYLAAGAVVLASRLIYRSPRKLAPQPVMKAAPATPDQAEVEVVRAENDQDLVLMAAA